MAITMTMKIWYAGCLLVHYVDCNQWQWQAIYMITEAGGLRQKEITTIDL